MTAKKSKRKDAASSKKRERDVRTERLRKALSKQPKSKLVEWVLEFASRNKRTLNELEARLDVQPADEHLVAAVRQAIADATDFDERRIGHNFDYDYHAYDKVQRGLQRLVKAGQLQTAMELCLELMRKGSYQVEMSDEGLMSYDISRCIEVVIRALEESDLPAPAISTWCDAMLRADRVACICDDELKALRDRPGG